MVKTILYMPILSILLLITPLYGADCDRAKTYFTQALELNNDTPNLIKKEQIYLKAIDLCPSYAEAHNNLGDVYERQGRFEEAIAQYKKVLELIPDKAYPYFGLGDIYYKTNRAKEAIIWYEKGLKYDPDDSLARERLVFAKDIQKGGVIKAETIRGMFSTTRGVGDVVSITFGEGLIPFDYNKSDIRPDARPQLEEIGKALRDAIGSSKDIAVAERGTPAIEIAGHTDIRGTDEYNLGLSKRRAESVVDYLVRNFNIPKDRLIPKGYGERVNLCTIDSSEACHALNRRVEIAKRGSVEGGPTWGISTQRDLIEEQDVRMDLGFFYQKEGSKLVEVIQDEKSRMRSRSDRYFIFFRPLQDCYVYILQEDPKDIVDLLFPQKGESASVKAGKDYWIPSFGKGYTLDDTTGEEKIYLLATSWPLESEIEGLSLKEQVRGTVRGLQTRIIKVVRPSGAPESLSSEELNKKHQKINEFIERVEGEGGWVRWVKFRHE